MKQFEKLGTLANAILHNLEKGDKRLKDLRELLKKEGLSFQPYTVSIVLQRLKKKGYVNNFTRGVWRITSKGKKYLKFIRGGR